MGRGLSAGTTRETHSMELLRLQSVVTGAIYSCSSAVFLQDIPKTDSVINLFVSQHTPMPDSAHLTKEWLTLFLLREVELSAAEKDHLFRCPQCANLLAQCSRDISRYGDEPEEENP